MDDSTESDKPLKDHAQKNKLLWEANSDSYDGKQTVIVTITSGRGTGPWKISGNCAKSKKGSSFVTE
jgi:hypothetical protein